MKKLYFIRHGLSEMNALGLFAGLSETALTKEGKHQARAAGRLAKDLGIDLIVSSPMTRAIGTAEIIAAEINYPLNSIIQNKLFIERDFGALEGQPWSPDLNLDGISDLETDDTLLERARLGLQWLKNQPADNILLVSHGAYGRAMRSVIQAKHFLEQDRLNNAEIQDWI